MPARECNFCGQHHPSDVIDGGGYDIIVVHCPNLPSEWVAIGPDDRGDVVIRDLSGTT